METIIPLWWKYGGPRDIWIRYADLVKQTIDKYRIKPVLEATLADMRAGGVIVDGSIMGGANPAMNPGATRLMMASPQPAISKAKIKFPPFPGGIKGPHVHYNGQVYMLNVDQWKGFAEGLRVEFITKLKAAKGISNIQQAIDIAEVIDGLG